LILTQEKATNKGQRNNKSHQGNEIDTPKK
jgi:hypothetical protein